MMGRDPDSSGEAQLNPQMIVLARQSRGLTQAQLATRVKCMQGTISKIEAGIETPSSERLAALAQALDYPVHFFTRTEPIEGPSVSEVFHRMRQRASASTLNKIHANAVIRRFEVAALLRSWDGLPEEPFPILPVDHFDGDVEKIARTVRAMLRVPPGPVFSMTKTIESGGGIIIECDFETPYVDGFSRRMGSIPLFYLNRQLPPDRWRYTLAHELGHVVLHSGVVPYDTMEKDADLFAGEFLAPKHEIKPQLTNLTLSRLAGLKEHWKISMQALLMRAYHLGMISDRFRSHMFVQLTKAGYRLREPKELDPPAEPPELLSTIVRYHQEELGYSDDDLCRALAISRADLYAWYRPGDRRLHAVS